jgi:hypothetical protein
LSNQDAPLGEAGDLGHGYIQSLASTPLS